MVASIIKIGEEEYQVEGGPRFRVVKRSTGAAYSLTFRPDWCDCPAFTFRPHERPCKHLSALGEHLMATKEKVAEAEFTATEAPTGNLPAVIQAAPLVPIGRALMSAPNLARALIAAQASCRSVEKDRTNAYHKYKYTSAEAIIGEGKDTLSASGLALMPIGLHVNGHQREGEERFELEREFLLIHESGESIPLKCHWPICPEKGRPLDKATAIADTLSLAYTIRDLLLMPRVDEADDANARNDTGKRDERNGQPEQESAPPEEPEIGPEDLERLQEIIGSLPADPERIPSLFRRFKVKGLKQLRASSYQDALKFLTGNLPITEEQTARIQELVKELRVPTPRVKERLHDLYRCESFSQLKCVQASDMIERLVKSKVIQNAPAVGAEK